MSVSRGEATGWKPARVGVHNEQDMLEAEAQKGYVLQGLSDFIAKSGTLMRNTACRLEPGV
jgi:hypothetical protein